MKEAKETSKEDKEGLQEVTRKRGVTWKELEMTVKDREKVEEDGISNEKAAGARK